MRTPSLPLVFVLALPLTELPAQGLDADRLETLEWRGIGPFRGGRSAAVAGHADQRNTYYMGACGGGVWKTIDAGVTWKNVSDGFFGGSIGAVAVAPSDPNTVYVGGGEVTLRGNVSSGDGMWKSRNGGRTWQSIGLGDARHIPRIRIHPRDANLVYAAVLGHLSGPSEERGIYRSKDGGENWQRILFANDHAGGCDLVLDPSDPQVLYASTWRVTRLPWTLESGGEGSALWKSTDGGDTWQDLSKNKGMPEGSLGIIGIDVCRSNPQRVYAIVEAEKGGVFRSEDGGDSWREVNSNRSLRQRAWYYTRIYADPVDADKVYVLNVGFHRSDDGGQTFDTRIRVPHGDNHDLWIDPGDPQRMIEANDGGANVSFDAGKTWSAQDNQPTAQFYRVTTDNHFPYRIYGAQQDNSTVRIASRSNRSTIGERDWESTAGGESGHIAPNRVDPEIVFGGSYGGYLQRLDHRTGLSQMVNVWPDNPMGWGAAELKYRFQWNFPIFYSPHDPQVLYTAGNVLFRTTNDGQSWQAISPDLTRNDKSKQESSGGPITKDNTSIEYYCTIFAALESPLEKGVLWCGSDDGLIHVSRNGGDSWNDVTPKGLPEWMQINSIEAHPFEKGGLYVAGTRYKLDDFTPYLYRTTDYGLSWTRIDEGIDRQHFTRVVRADPVRRGLLYAGTERGVYVSSDDGERWQPLELGLPIVPITDLAVREGDLIAATQGRSFWILDDLDHLRQVAAGPVVLYQPEPVVRTGGGRTVTDRAGVNPRPGVVVRFWLDEEPADELSLSLQTLEGEELHRVSAKGKGSKKLEASKGMNLVEWNLRLEDAERFDGMVMWAGYTRGPLVVPGRYRVVLALGEETGSEIATEFEVLEDPRSLATTDDLRAQFDFLLNVRDKLTESHRAIGKIRAVRSQVNDVLGRAQALDEDLRKPLDAAGKKLKERMTTVEEALYQTKNQSRQDPLNYPIRLTNKLAALAGTVARGDWRPTAQAQAVKKYLVEAIDSRLAEWRSIQEGALRAFSSAALEAAVPHVFVPDKKDG